MIEIKKINDEDKAKKICDRFQLNWHPDYHVIATLDGEELLQCAVFSYKKDRGEILVIDGFEDDIGLLDGLCRAILNIMDINGVKDVCLSLKYDKIAQCIGFKREDYHYSLNLEGFFKCGCCHKTEVEQ